MKLWHFQLDEKVYPMCLNGTALFDIYEKYGDKGSILDLIEGNNRQSFRATCWMLAKLCEQGELVQRHLGQTPMAIPTEAMFRLMLSPLDLIRAKHAIRNTVKLGFGREVTEEDEPKRVDLGLLELQKKTGPASAGPSIFRRLRSFWAWVCGRECS